MNKTEAEILREASPAPRPFRHSGYAPMGKRIGAYLLDSLFQVLLIVAIALLLYFGLAIAGFSGNIATILPILLLMYGGNFFTAMLLWAGRGYTPGKWLLKIKVETTDGGRISFWDAMLRELFLKGIVNIITGSLLNLISLIWGCATPEHKTVHDLAAGTRVVLAPR